MHILKRLIALMALAFLAFPALAFAHEGPSFELEGDEFEVQGTVTEVGDGTFTVFGQTVTVDPAAVSEFEQEGTVAVGTEVKAEGMVVDGTLFAEEVKVDGVDEDEVEDDDD